jgi:hypothetical protein
MPTYQMTLVGSSRHRKELYTTRIVESSLVVSMKIHDSSKKFFDLFMLVVT